MKDKPPKGGWLGPPPTTGLVPIAVANGSRNGKWKWKENKLSEKQQKRHAKFKKRMAKADKKKEWRF